MFTQKMAALCVEGFLNIPKSTLLDCRHRLTNGFLIQAFQTNNFNRAHIHGNWPTLCRQSEKRAVFLECFFASSGCEMLCCGAAPAMEFWQSKYFLLFNSKPSKSNRESTKNYMFTVRVFSCVCKLVSVFAKLSSARPPFFAHKCEARIKEQVACELIYPVQNANKLQPMKQAIFKRLFEMSTKLFFLTTNTPNHCKKIKF